MTRKWKERPLGKFIVTGKVQSLVLPFLGNWSPFVLFCLLRETTLSRKKRLLRLIFFANGWHKNISEDFLYPEKTPGREKMITQIIQVNSMKVGTADSSKKYSAFLRFSTCINISCSLGQAVETSFVHRHYHNWKITFYWSGELCFGNVKKVKEKHDSLVTTLLLKKQDAFSEYVVPQFQNEASFKNHSQENEFYLHENGFVGEHTERVWKVSHKDSFWQRGKRQLSNAYLYSCLNSNYELKALQD